jgi:hypothetical protein
MSLTPSERLAIEAIQKNYGKGDIKEVKILHTSDFTDEEDVPGGLLMIHPLNTKVHVDSIPNNAFNYMAIVPILPKKDGSNDWSDHLAAMDSKILNEFVPQFSSMPPSLKTRAINSHLDGKSWNTEFGEDESAFAGVFKQVRGRESYFYIVAQAGAPVACKQLREKIGRSVGGMTFEQLMEDKDYNYCNYVAQRNVERIAYNVARALKLPVKQVTDIGSHKEYEHSGLPMRAIPAYLQPVSTITPLVHNSERVIGVFNKLTPVANAAAVNFIYEGPYNGVAVFNMAKGGIGHALPAISGKVSNPVKLSTAEIAKRAKGVISEGGATKHADVTTEAYRSTDTDEFRDSMKELGWRVQNLTNLIPVMIKIFDPSVKRTLVK